MECEGRPGIQRLGECCQPSCLGLQHQGPLEAALGAGREQDALLVDPGGWNGLKQEPAARILAAGAPILTACMLRRGMARLLCSGLGLAATWQHLYICSGGPAFCRPTSSTTF